MQTHTFKTWRKFYHDVSTGKKTFEIRKDDRPIKPQVGDIINLVETYDGTKDYTGRSIMMIVTYVLDAGDVPDMLQPGYYIMGIKLYIEVTKSCG